VILKVLTLPALEYVSRVVEYRTLKERRLFGRSKGYRDLTLAGAEPDKPAERYMSPVLCCVVDATVPGVTNCANNGVEVAHRRRPAHLFRFLHHEQRLSMHLAVVLRLIVWHNTVRLYMMMLHDCLHPSHFHVLGH
jgi:hypothetical protein